MSRVLLVLLVAAALAGCGGDQQRPTPAATQTVAGSIPFRIIEEALIGAAVPSRDQVRVQVAHSPKEWASLWQEVTANRSPTRPPAIDFSREQIVLVIAGPPARGIKATSISGTDRALRIAVKVTVPAPGCGMTAEVRSPYQFLAVRDARDRTASLVVTRETDTCG